MEMDQKECKQFWDKVDTALEKALYLLTNSATGMQDVLHAFKEKCDEGKTLVGWDVSALEALTKIENKIQDLKNLNQIQEQLVQSQQSNVTNTALASTLGPVAGIGAGLSLFPLMTKLLKI